MFKLGMSLVFAVIAALVIIISGIVTDARLITILFRMVVGFLVTGLVVYLIAFLLEAKGIVGFDKYIIPPVPDSKKNGKEDEAAGEDGTPSEDGAATGAEGSENAETGAGSEGSFQPLADDVEHIEEPAAANPQG